ncbi:MAG: TIGR04282 family arsenosugar biosynthesis glycosyltransferase [Lentisphaeraceae bacterium]|nr:TIGR04282 family arsenosugar biosynthesis glycosyltransferase [Lentisphaeraceae bacterium]
MKICVFARLPELGKVKSRLAETCGDKRTLEIYQRMLADVTSMVSSSKYKSVFYLAGDSEELFRQFSDRYDSKKQVDGDLGLKLKSAVSEQFLDETEKLTVIGTDCIDISHEELADVETYLDDVDVVLGPATDGGYYLIAMNKPYTCLFENIDWGSARVFEQTMTILHEQNISYRLLSEKNDLDYWEDLPQDWQDELSELCINES